MLAVQGLAKAEAGSASAVFSMLRNLGGAVGTALLTQLVSLRERFHGQRINESLTLFDAPVQQRLPGGVLDAQAPAHLQVLAQLDQTVHQQAYLMAYSDAFYVSCVALAVCALACAPPNSVFYQEAGRRASPAMRPAAALAHILLVILRK